ncbi:transposase [Myroides marinus]|uniref:transposase n=2 Tax=Myroides marinus TaxID=703342 RepID=UPI0025780C02|nr:transposase [Myroides marinus]MDM1346530.1 transposase [Myroides marinus]MDM1354692.1 transposase [Myroides marinus]MDM1360969.1 transposase [Myroides marinus]MDM1368294.1 transposase [Myroides marinus]MDM1373347.1 transposase [Myroides marinus]
MGRKQKYNLEFKLRIVAIILEGKNSIKGLARVENISDSNIHYWLKVYETYGEQGLLGIRQSSFTLEEKVNIIQEHQNTGLSLMDTCVKYRISDPSVLFQWIRKFKNKGFKGLEDNRGAHFRKIKTTTKMTKKSAIPGLKDSMSEIEKLRIELEYLRAENAYLKKLEALAQSKQAKKKKP